GCGSGGCRAAATSTRSLFTSAVRPLTVFESSPTVRSRAPTASRSCCRSWLWRGGGGAGSRRWTITGVAAPSTKATTVNPRIKGRSSIELAIDLRSSARPPTTPGSVASSVGPVALSAPRDPLLRAPRRRFGGRRARRIPVAHVDRPCGRAPVVVQRHRRDAVAVALARAHVLVDPLEAALLAEALLVLERDGADLREEGRRIPARRALDFEAAQVVHAAPARVARRPEPGEAHAVGGRDRGQVLDRLGLDQLGGDREPLAAAGGKRTGEHEEHGRGAPHRASSRVARASWRATSRGAVPPRTRLLATERAGVRRRTSAGVSCGACLPRTVASSSRSDVPVARQCRTSLPTIACARRKGTPRSTRRSA